MPSRHDLLEDTQSVSRAELAVVWLMLVVASVTIWLLPIALRRLID
jgi:hypothetical protein